MLLLLSGQCYAAVTVPVDDSAAIEFYKNSQLVVSKATVNPFDLAGCIVLTKEGQEDTYINILPESIKKSLKPQNLSNKPYRTMLTESQAVKVGFLGVLGISTKNNSLLEIAIDDRWKLEGPSFWNNNELKESVLSIGKIYMALGYTVKYNQNVQYSNLTTSTYTESSGEVTSTFTYVDGSGKQYAQSSSYAQKELISIAPFDITPILASWQPKEKMATAFNISDATIRDLQIRSTNAMPMAIEIKQGDMSEISGLRALINSNSASTALQQDSMQ